MALEGSIKDFALIEIFQLISLQKKTGILTAQNGEDRVTINFEKGQIVYATINRKNEGEKIGKLLVYAEKIKEEDLKEAINIQKETGEKLGKILVSRGYIDMEDLMNVLQVQVKDVIFQILKWKEGWYRFERKTVEIEEETIPIPTDAVLMEGARMLDEWPEIESIIPSDDMVFSQSFKADDAGLLFSTLNEDEIYVFNLIDSKRTVRDIINSTRFSEFEAYKILATLLLSGLISVSSPLSRETTLQEESKDRTIWWNFFQGSIPVLILSIVFLFIPLTEIMGIRHISTVSRTIDRLDSYKNISRIEEAIDFYFVNNQHLPENLQVLVKGGYIPEYMLYDPLSGKIFPYKVVEPLRPDGYILPSKESNL